MSHGPWGSPGAFGWALVLWGAAFAAAGMLLRRLFRDDLRDWRRFTVPDEPPEAATFRRPPPRKWLYHRWNMGRIHGWLRGRRLGPRRRGKGLPSAPDSL